jgi:predicted DNA binding CopG/RHH family protein
MRLPWGSHRFNAGSDPIREDWVERSGSGKRAESSETALIAGSLSTGMLQAMQQTAPAQPSPMSSSFAGLLASLTAQRSDRGGDRTQWNDADLGDDFATISYESALRAHARYRVDERERLRKPASPAKQTVEAAPAQPNQPTQQFPAAHDLRTASVTIRLSKAECELMHQRAAEAGLTVSAYLRSCVLEADALRAQVKQALAEMRKTGNEGTREQGNKTAGSEGAREQRNEGPRRTNLFGWVARLLLRWRSSQAVRRC